MSARPSGVKPCQHGASGPSLRQRVNYAGVPGSAENQNRKVAPRERENGTTRERGKDLGIGTIWVPYRPCPRARFNFTIESHAMR